MREFNVTCSSYTFDMRNLTVPLTLHRGHTSAGEWQVMLDTDWQRLYCVIVRESMIQSVGGSTLITCD